MTLYERLKALAGVDCVLGNQMKGRIVAVSPEVSNHGIEASINLSTFTIKLDWGPTVVMSGWTVASIEKLY
jgi:hypothetical protein